MATNVHQPSGRWILFAIASNAEALVGSAEERPGDYEDQTPRQNMNQQKLLSSYRN